MLRLIAECEFAVRQAHEKNYLYGELKTGIRAGVQDCSNIREHSCASL